MKINALTEQKSITDSAGKFQMISGLWMNGITYWADSMEECIFHELGISLQVKEVDFHSKVRFYKIHINNHLPNPRKVKLLLQHCNYLQANEKLSFLSPAENVTYHAADEHIYLVNGFIEGEQLLCNSIQPDWNIDRNVIWSCAEKGELKYQPLARGNTASIYAHDIYFSGKNTCKGEVWLIKGQEKTDLLNINTLLLKNTLAFHSEK